MKKVNPVIIPYARFPESTQHIIDVMAMRKRQGHSNVYTISRVNARRRRRRAVRGTLTRPNYDRDEFPLAMTEEGGDGADIRYITPADNRGCGAYISQYLRSHNLKDGDFIIFVIQ